MFLKLLFSCLLLGICLANDLEAEDEFYYEDSRPYSGARNNVFDWNLVKKIITDEKTNAIVSPFSVKLLLVLLYEATGYSAAIHTTTELELRQILSNPAMPDITSERAIFKSILDSALTKHKDYDLKIGTKIFVDEFIQVVAKYESLIKFNYHADIENVTFSKVRETVNNVNAWCSEVTEGHIKNLINDDSVKNAVMLMVNAIYFKGKWSYPFPENDKFIRSFYTAGNKAINVQFMEQSNSFYYDDSTKLNAQLLRLPYRGKKFSMIIVLPNEGSSVNEFLEQVTPTELNLAMWYMEEVDVNVTLPKFKFDFSSNLNEALEALGIHEIFTNNASLPLLSRGVGTRNELKVSNVIQKAGIAVNEKGSTAYAATEIQLVNKFGGDSTRIFIANRPFLFFIEDETNGALLFAGKVENPKEIGKQ